MTITIPFYNNPSAKDWAPIITRPGNDDKDLEKVVKGILANVKLNGAKALRKYALQFDNADISEPAVAETEILAAEKHVDKSLKEAILLAKKNIETFHGAQKTAEQIIETMPGVTCSRKSVPIERVGLYIPGGSAPLFSTLLMLGIPAKIAGCGEIIICTPPRRDGNIDPVILYVAGLLDIKKIYKTGGAQAIAAMAYGAGDIQPVYKIFGPGNRYVTTAKQLVSTEGVAIDMPAGPSEVAVYADRTCVPGFVAADLLSQAEHGPDSQVLLVTPDEQTAMMIKQELFKQMESLPRKAIVLKSLACARFVILPDVEVAFDLLNAYAPEHLIIASADAETLAEKVVNAGSVFLGNFSAESMGDYASGTNHTLPTNGYAKAYSGVSVDSFVKKITFQKITREGLENIGPAVEILAAAEGLNAHKNAVSIRLKEIKQNSNNI